MKKILQRIGLLAVTGMLLWGYQGMEAKAAVTAENIIRLREGVKLEKWDFTYNLENCSLSYGFGVGYGSGCKNAHDDNHYVIFIEPEDGYCFANEPTVTAKIMNDGGYVTEDIKLKPIGKSSATTGYGYEVCELIDKRGTLDIQTEAVNLDLSTKFIENEGLLPNDTTSSFSFYTGWNLSYDSVTIQSISYHITNAAGDNVDDLFQVETTDYAGNNGEKVGQGVKVSYKTQDRAPSGKYTMTVTMTYDDIVPYTRKEVTSFEFTVGEAETTTPETDTSESSDDSQEDPYKIIEGTRSTWNGSTSEGLTIRGDGDFEKFAGVRVDGNWIPSAHYEAKSGSTIVTLKPSYLASLSEGEHTVDIMWIDDSASTTFTVAANTAAAQPELDSVPKTGEGVMGWMPEILLFAAAGLTAMGALRLKRAK